MIVILEPSKSSKKMMVPIGTVLLVQEHTIRARRHSHTSVSSREDIIKPLSDMEETSNKYLADCDRFKTNRYAVFQAIAPGQARVRYAITDYASNKVDILTDVSVIVDPSLPKSVPTLEDVRIMINTWRLRPKDSLHFDIPVPYRVVVGPLFCKSAVRHRKNKSKLSVFAEQTGTCIILVAGAGNEVLLEIPIIVEK